MEEAYRSYYRRVFEGTATWPGLFPASERPAYFDEAEAVRRTVVGVAGELATEGVRVREDAELFLFLNAWQLVVRPILEVREASLSVLLETVRADMLKVARSAGDEARAEVAESEVSGHRIVNALARSWSDLRITDWRLWED